MNKDLKDLIDSIDSTNKAHSDLETMIKYLKEEVQRLNFTVNEQKKIIQEQSIKLNQRNISNLPQDILLLKDLVLTQRQEIMKKDKDIEILQKTIEDLSADLVKAEKFEEDNEELIYANKTIVQLTEENETYKSRIESLGEELKILKHQLDLKSHEIVDEDQELIDAKKLIFQLTEENGISKVKIESLRLQNNELKEKMAEQEQVRENIAKELVESERLIDQLTYDNDNLHEKVNYLQQKLEETIKETQNTKTMQSEKPISEKLQNDLNTAREEIIELKNIINSNINIIESLQQKNLSLEAKRKEELKLNEQKMKEFSKLISDRDKELEQLKAKFKKIQNSNKQLSDLIVELRTIEQKTPILSKNSTFQRREDFDQLPSSLFLKMYCQLNESSKNVIIDHLIEDLNSKNRDLKIHAIKFLRILKGNKAFEALKSLKDDEDWIIKLYLIKALQYFKREEIESTLNFLRKDKDNDVREAANELLLKIG